MNLTSYSMSRGGGGTFIYTATRSDGSTYLIGQVWADDDTVYARQLPGDVVTRHADFTSARSFLFAEAQRRDLQAWL